MSPNPPKADKAGFNVLNLNFLKNDPQIGRRPIKGEIIFLIKFYAFNK